MVETIYWREPLWLLLILLPLLLSFLIRLKRRYELLQLADRHLLPWLIHQGTEQAHQQGPSPVWLIAGWVSLCVALAGPRTLQQLPPDYQALPTGMMIILDMSASMNAGSGRISRRQLAQQQLSDWFSGSVTELAAGLMVFSGDSFELVAPTRDLNVLRHFITVLPDLKLPVSGNALAAAITKAQQSLKAKTDQYNGHDRIVILTDGDIESEGKEKVVRLLRSSQSEHGQIHFIGIGDSRSVTIHDEDHRVMQKHGQPVLSRLESDWMIELANQSGVFFHHLTGLADKDLSAIIQLPESRLDNQTRQLARYDEWFWIPLLLAMALLYVGLTGRAAVNSQSPVQSPLIVSILITGVLLIGFGPSFATDSDPLKQAQDALQQHNYQRALKWFRQVDSMEGRFGEGVSCYRLQDYSCAIGVFTDIAWHGDGVYRARAVFNLANSYFYSGDFEQAQVLYRDAGLLGIDESLVRHNLEFTRHILQSIEKHLQQLADSIKNAQWKMAVRGEMASGLNEQLYSDQHLFEQLGIDPKEFDASIPRSLLASRLRQMANINVSPSSGQFVQLERLAPQGSADILNRLFAFQAGLASVPEQPIIRAGQRPW